MVAACWGSSIPGLEWSSLVWSGHARGRTPSDCWGMLKYWAGGSGVDPTAGVAFPWAIAWENWARLLMACLGDTATTAVVVGVTCLSCSSSSSMRFLCSLVLSRSWNRVLWSATYRPLSSKRAFGPCSSCSASLSLSTAWGSAGAPSRACNCC